MFYEEFDKVKVSFVDRLSLCKNAALLPLKHKHWPVCVLLAKLEDTVDFINLTFLWRYFVSLLFSAMLIEFVSYLCTNSFCNVSSCCNTVFILCFSHTSLQSWCWECWTCCIKDHSLKLELSDQWLPSGVGILWFVWVYGCLSDCNVPEGRGFRSISWVVSLTPRHLVVLWSRLSDF